MNISVMYCVDNNNALLSAVSAASLLRNADVSNHYTLYILHSGLTTQNQKFLTDTAADFPNAETEIVSLDDCLKEEWSSVFVNNCIPITGLCVLAASSIFPQLDKLIAVDGQGVFLGDISECYSALSADDNEYYGCANEKISQKNALGGCTLVNLSALRSDGAEKSFLRFLSQNLKRKPLCAAQTIQACCNEADIKKLPLRYAVSCDYYNLNSEEEEALNYAVEEVKDALNNPVYLYWSGNVQPWKNSEAVKAAEWREAALLSGYADEVKRFYDSYSAAAKRFIEPSEICIAESEKPAVEISVLCCTYNHEQFIEKTLEAVASQKTSASFEIIVSDDASTDNTQPLIEKVIAKYPSVRWKPVLRKENVGIGTNYYEALQQVEGKYLCICDGDDLWIDDTKLQKQYDFMQSHENCSVLCASFRRHYVTDSGKPDDVFYVGDYVKQCLPDAKTLGFNELLKCCFIGSCTVMMRWALQSGVPEFFRFYSLIDYPLELIHAAYGEICYMNDFVPSEYRVHSGGVMSQVKADKFEAMRRTVILEVNQYLNYSFTRCVSDLLEPDKSRRNTEPGTEALGARIKTKIKSVLKKTSETDANNKQKMLVIAMGNSIHTARWLSMLSDLDCEIHLFSSYTIPTVEYDLSFPSNVTKYNFISVRVLALKYALRHPFSCLKMMLKFDFPKLKASIHEDAAKDEIKSLAELIDQNDYTLIHTLHTQTSAALLLRTLPYVTAQLPVWVHTVWGSDLFFHQWLADSKAQLMQIMPKVDLYWGEGRRDYKLARELGFNGEFLPPIPAFGGFDFSDISANEYILPSKRKKILVKGYQNVVGRAVMAFHALELCAELLEGYEIILFSFENETMPAIAQEFTGKTGVPIRCVQGVPYSEILKLHSESRMYLGLSTSDGLPSSFMEAMMCGEFPVQSDTSMGNEWAVQGETAFFVSPFDVREIASYIKTVLTDDELVDKAGEINRETCRQRLDNADIAKQVMREYQSIIEGSPILDDM